MKSQTSENSISPESMVDDASQLYLSNKGVFKFELPITLNLLHLQHEPLPVWIPANSYLIPDEWTGNISKGMIGPIVESRFSNFTFWDHDLKCFEEAFQQAQLKLLCDFVFHRILLESSSITELTTALGCKTKAAALQQLLLTRVPAAQEGFLELLRARGAKYNFSLGEMKALVYLSTRAENVDLPPANWQSIDPPIQTTSAVELLEETHEFVVKDGEYGFRDHEGLFPLRYCLEVINVDDLEEFITACSNWELSPPPETHLPVRHHPTATDKDNDEEEEEEYIEYGPPLSQLVIPFYMREKFRGILKKVCHLYREYAPQLLQGWKPE
ncbi:hypothetical protein BDZ91DRAFT_768127 [Kalaharituber pfeilii]|nr:hypothetical protein BDZ91DRAFT_768127 [Kalaharituber pfeilii]